MTTCWWSQGPRPGNLGDVLTPHLLKGLGHPVRWAAQGAARMIAIGSIVRFARPGQYVWGSGAMRVSDRPCPGAHYLAVRGPITRGVVMRQGGDCPEVYGDPALLLPLVHNGHVPVRHELAIVPHYVDRTDPQVVKSGLPVISPLNANPLAVVDAIRACRAVLSSSLHGIIVAHAYGIPAAWVRLGNKLDGDDTKFMDYAMSMGIELEPYRTIGGARPVLPVPFYAAPLRHALEAIA
jgi:hypothetical protein